MTIPVLRKDFIVHAYQIYEARAMGAAAVLLICAILDEKTLQSYLELAHSLGLSALVEAHDEREVHMALRCGARVIGVNNRNLNDLRCLFRRVCPCGHLFRHRSFHYGKRYQDTGRYCHHQRPWRSGCLDW